MFEKNQLPVTLETAINPHKIPPLFFVGSVLSLSSDDFPHLATVDSTRQRDNLNVFTPSFLHK